MGAWWFAEEQECKFLDAETQPFGREEFDRDYEIPVDENANEKHV